MFDLARIIKLMRVNSNLNQGELAEILGVTKTYISLLENGRKEPSLSLVKCFSKHFKIPLWLLLWDGFELPENHTSADLKIKKEFDAFMPQIKTYFFEKIADNAV
jgi:DNA-binding XRE family transcriptional regulator